MPLPTSKPRARNSLSAQLLRSPLQSRPLTEENRLLLEQQSQHVRTSHNRIHILAQAHMNDAPGAQQIHVDGALDLTLRGFDERMVALLKKWMVVPPFDKAQKIWPCVPQCPSKLFTTLHSLQAHMNTCPAAHALAAAHQLRTKTIYRTDSDGTATNDVLARLTPIRQLTPVLVIVLQDEHTIAACPFDRCVPPHTHYLQDARKNEFGVPYAKYSFANGSGRGTGGCCST